MANVVKVVLNGKTIIDITDTTALASDVVRDKVFYDASGTRTTGVLTAGGSAAAAHIFDLTLEYAADWAQAQEDALNSLPDTSNTGVEELLPGDICILRQPIADNSNNYVYTSFIYVAPEGDNSYWSVMNGNVRADNVYFDADMIYTEDIGAIKLETGKSSGTFNSEGKSLKEIFQSIMSSIKNPTITSPKFTMTVNGITNTGNLEIGSKITAFTWNGTYTDGSYEFGYKDGTAVNTNKAAGCTATYAISCTVVGTASGQTVDGTWTFTNPVTINSTSSKSYGTLTNVCTYSDSPRTPVNNIGQEVSGQITTSSITQGKAITLAGYREGFFCGVLTTAKDVTSLSSADIRALTKSGKAYNAGAKNYTIPVGAAMVIFGCPKDKTGITNIHNTSANANMNNVFKITNPTVISVQGADATDTYAADYNIWAYTPADPYTSTADLVITLG